MSRASDPADRATTPPSASTTPPTFDGFWLPARLRARLIGEDTCWQEVRFARGRECGVECPADEPGAVTARWPLFTYADWAELMEGLHAARETAPRGGEYWERLQTALSAAAGRLADPARPHHRALVEALPTYTGYSPGMLAGTFGGPELWNLAKMEDALHYQPNKVCGVRWQKMPGLPGRLRFFPSRSLDKVAGWIPVAWEMPLFRTDTRPGVVLAYGAGNIPGSSLMMIILALAATLRGDRPLPRLLPPPVVLARNSIREPILTPLVLSAIEEVDPELVAMVTTAVWDHDDQRLQAQLMREADLVVAAAGDETISTLAARVRSARPRPRFHAHGHKVSFTVIGREVLEIQSVIDDRGWTPPGGTELIDIVALLAGLDTAFWDQNGCLSSRIHFVQRGGPADDLPAEYARRLTKRLRQLEQVMPRGAWPLRKLHDPFDRFKAIEGSDRWGTGLRVVSDYDDPFVVVLDERTGRESRLDPSVFASMVNECQTRVVIVRPIDDIMEVPWRYLGMLPRRSLQSLSVALGGPGQGMTRDMLAFATACGSRGVTAIRTVGRGAFPQPAYSWDGLLPLDVVGCRPAGHFTTIEFDSPFEDLMATYRAHLARLARLAPVDRGGLVTPV